MKKNALIIFTRVPVEGQTKTRLMPYFTPKQCKELHICFLKDIAKMCGECDTDVFVCHTPEDEHHILHDIFGTEAQYFLQTGEGLGVRMYQAIETVLSNGYEASVLIGTDVPEVSSKDIRQAFEILKTKDVVFGPTADGGYYLVGMKEARKETFEKQTYGHASVLENTIHGLRESGLTVGLGKKKYDIDTREDICAYRDRMRKYPSLQKTWTGKYLMRTTRISVIVPIYNEESTIDHLLKQLEPVKDRCEIILVDGESTDSTLDHIGLEFRVLHSEKGRAKQMNLGARESTGDILFFLHCDSELPEKWMEQIRYVTKDYRFGCFGIAFHSKNFFMLTCRVISNHRIKDRKVVFGDQGIFIDRKLFFDVGMFPDIPLMEDYQFSLTLKERGEKIGITKKRIHTSERRFPEGTIPKLREMWKMNRLRKKYRDGVDIETIARMYDDVR
ncbi:MAG: TIGR04283 family arsenosugar biosynthesis glycosyltransferase [Lachnospiraceae bacterium]